MLALTVWLGVWQLQRLAWKTGLLAELDRGEAAAPVALSANPLPFTKVEATGRLRDDLVALYGSEVRSTQAGPAMGAQLITPLERPGADPVLVDRGWAPQGVTLPPSPDPVRIVGYVRAPETPIRFGATDDPAARRFYALDPAAIGAALGLPRVAPFTLVAIGPPDVMPQPVQVLPRPVNNHLAYAFTWFGLAASLLGVFAVYARRALRP